MRTAVWSVLHFLVDMVCAWAMYAFFFEGNYGSLLVYNFCAFALQLPFGTLLDLYRERFGTLPAACAAVGIALTVIGAFLNPALLGIGNALFHTGAGVDVIEEDFSRKLQGRNLGIFVAPGAIGLYLGMYLGKKTHHPLIGMMAGVTMLLLLICQRKKGSVSGRHALPVFKGNAKLGLLTLCCFLVVIIRSFVGLSGSFPWKSLPLMGVLAVCATAAGKCCGGFLASRFGLGKTVAATLLLASVCYLLAETGVFGLTAIFLFNMSMPLTLYLLAAHLPTMPGFAFGLLTFGLFLGFLPVYWQVDPGFSTGILGAVGSIISCALLIAAGKAGEYHRVSS